MTATPKSRAPWALIAGARRTGKTSLARAAIAGLRERGLRVVGVLQEAVEREGERQAYEAVRVAEPTDRVIVARRGAPASGETPICSFSFDDAAFARVASWLAEDEVSADVIVIDEVSKAESRGRGHAAAIDRALQGAALVVLCVRADELSFVVDRFALPDAVASLDTTAPQDLATFVDTLTR